MSKDRPTGFRLQITYSDGKTDTFDGTAAAVVTFGRGSDNTIPLQDPSRTVSRRHAQLEVADGDARLRDLSSANGSKVNGRDIGKRGVQQLDDGDEIELGLVRIGFRWTTAGDPRAWESSEPSGETSQSPAATRRTRDVLEEFDRFAIVRIVETHGMSTVAHAIDTRHDTDVFLTRIPQAAVGFLGRFRFLSECQRGLGLEHENLLAPTECGKSGGEFWIVSPYAAGVTVAEIMDTDVRSLPVQAAAYIAQHVAAGLAYLEKQKGRAYRAEVNDRVVVVGSTGAVWLRGVGIPRVGEPPAAGRFLAPEEEGGRPGDARATVYALGVLLYELLAREMIDVKTKRTLKRIDTVRIECGRRLAQVVMRAVDARPDRRFDGPIELAEALMAELGERTAPYGRGDVGMWVAKHFPDLVDE